MLLPRKMLELERHEALGWEFSWTLQWSGSSCEVCLPSQSPCRVLEHWGGEMQTRKFLVLLRYSLGVQRAASLSVGAGTSLECEAVCQEFMVQGLSFPLLKLGVIYKFLKTRSLFRAITQLPLNILPTLLFLMLLISVASNEIVQILVICYSVLFSHEEWERFFYSLK